MSEGYKSKNYEFKGQKTSRPSKALLKKNLRDILLRLYTF